MITPHPSQHIERYGDRRYLPAATEPRFSALNDDELRGEAKRASTAYAAAAERAKLLTDRRRVVWREMAHGFVDAVREEEEALEAARRAAEHSDAMTAEIGVRAGRLGYCPSCLYTVTYADGPGLESPMWKRTNMRAPRALSIGAALRQWRAAVSVGDSRC